MRNLMFRVLFFHSMLTYLHVCLCKSRLCTYASIFKCVYSKVIVVGSSILCMFQCGYDPGSGLKQMKSFMYYM